MTTELRWQPSVPFEDSVAKTVAEINHWQDVPLWDPDSINEATKTWFKFMDSDRPES